MANKLLDLVKRYMGKLRILVIEDDLMHASKAEMLLDELDYALAGIAKNIDEAIRLFVSTKPDVVLMDIDLSDEKDGIELADKFNKINPVPIIFTTSFTDQETFERAKQTEPYAYLIKPLEKNSLQRSIELAVYNFARNFMREEIEADYFTGWSQNMMAQDSFFVKTSDCLEKVRYADVLWVEVSADRYCEIKTATKSFSIRASLKNLEQKLSPYQFVRTHRAYIVNIMKVDNINDREMTVGIGEHEVPMGNAYKQIIMDKLNIL